MIRILFKTFFKRFFGLFIAMIFISMLSISLLSGFGSTILNLEKQFKAYLADYEDVDVSAKTKIESREKLTELLNSTNGVEAYDFRLTIDAKMKLDNDRIITARFYTFNENEDTLFKRYVDDSIEKSTERVNVSLIKKFANNNNIKLGDTIHVGAFKVYIDLYVNEIVETPEAIQARANDYVWGDASDFGLIYVNETELDNILQILSTKIHEKILSDEDYKKYYEYAVKAMGIDIPDLADIALIGHNYASNYANHILIKGDDVYSEAQLSGNIKDKFTTNEVEVKEIKGAHQSFYILYIENCIKQLRVASIFLPLFFYTVTMIIIGLFISQIIKAMTKEIGVMMSVGVGFSDINSLFYLYIFLMSVASIALGLTGGYFLNRLMGSLMIRVYSIPVILKSLNIYVSIAASVSLLIFSEVTAVISCRAISRITPKDATLNNESKRKPLPKRLVEFIDKAPMNIKLGVNSIAQNPRRFFVSVFSIISSFSIILLALFFYVAKGELIDQSINRRLNFDAQIYATEVLDEEKVEALGNQEFVTAYENTYYTYLEVFNGDESGYVECLAIDSASTKNMVQIPNRKGNKTIQLEVDGIILPRAFAKKLGVKRNSTVVINGVKVKVLGVSNQYFHPIAYLSKVQMDKIGASYITSILINTNDEIKLLDYLDDNITSSLTVFTKNLNKDISGVFTSVDIMIYIMIGFSLLMAFIILCIMSENALMEQQRQLTVLRAIGFTIGNVSNVWTIQSLSQLIFSTIIAIPLGSLIAKTLFSLCSSTNQTYPFVFDIRVVAFAFAFIFVIIILTHTVSMITIKKWNIADNTRCRE